MQTDHTLMQSFWQAANGDPVVLQQASFISEGELPSVFAVTSFASAAVGSCGLALVSLLNAMGFDPERNAQVRVDRRLASFWFHHSIRPVGWKTPPSRDTTAGDYKTLDGWIRLHTNQPHHRIAALEVLKAESNRESVEIAVAKWRSDDLEAAIIENMGCAATMRSWEAWQMHPQGKAVMSEPLLHWDTGSTTSQPLWAFDRARPLEGLKVLDLTRVLAGPAATRMLAALGADVLRIDPPWWVEAGNAPEMSVGKRCARLDLREQQGRDQLKALIAQADVMVHGYRSDALDAMGIGTQIRQSLRPGLVDISLDAYGHTGPWRQRRGFDSLVQMSMGIADMGQKMTGADKPVPLPVQALDFATGFLLATAALKGLETRLRTGQGSVARASLARTGIELMKAQHSKDHVCAKLEPESAQDIDPRPEHTYWGLAHRVKTPLTVSGVEQYWIRPAGPLGSSEPNWL
jgi:hypothetical protein